MSSARTSAVLGRRTCALVAVGSASLHALMISHAGNLALGLLILGMAAACLFCAHDLWKCGSPPAWCIVAVMNLVMVAVHWSAPGHHHGAAVSAATAMPTSTPMTVATIVSIAEASVATVVLWAQTRHRTVSLAPQRH